MPTPAIARLFKIAQYRDILTARVRLDHPPACRSNLNFRADFTN